MEIGRFGVENLFEDELEFMVELTGEMKVEDSTLDSKNDIEELLFPFVKLSFQDGMLDKTRLNSKQ